MPRGRPPGPDAVERLAAKTKRNPITGCLEFQGVSSSNPYGRIKVHGINKYAHRIAWEAAHGPIPPGMDVLHHCDNPCCCEAIQPGHLFLGTHTENMADRDRKGRHVTHRGVDHKRAKLTEEDVRDIRRRYTQGETPASISRLYSHKVSPTRIDQIVWGRAWRHVPA